MKWLVVTSLVAAIVLVCSLSSVMGNKRVSKPIVQVYYETLCGDSRRFIQRQLYPLKTSSLGEYFYVDLIPYGKASTSRSGESYYFECQHGPNECSGNKLHACAIRYLNESDSLEFVHCSMSASYPPHALNECSQYTGFHKDDIQRCSEGPEGSELLARNGERTNSLKPKLYYVPWVTFSGVWDEMTFQDSLSNLKKTMCRELRKEGNAPEACEELQLTAEAKEGADKSGSVSWLVHRSKSNNLQLIFTATFLLVNILN